MVNSTIMDRKLMEVHILESSLVTLKAFKTLNLKFGHHVVQSILMSPRFSSINRNCSYTDCVYAVVQYISLMFS